MFSNDKFSESDSNEIDDLNFIKGLILKFNCSSNVDKKRKGFFLAINIIS